MPEKEFKEQVFQGKMGNKITGRIFKLALKYKGKLFGFIFFIALVAILEAIAPLLQREMLDKGLKINEFGEITPDKAIFMKNIILLGLLHVVIAVSVFLFIWFAGWLGERIMYDLRRKSFKHLQKLTFSFFDKTPIGWLMSRVTSDTNKIADLATWHLLDITWGVMHLVTASVAMMILNWKLGLIVIAGIPVTLWIAVKFRKHIVAEHRKVRAIDSTITAKYNENITGVRIVKSLVREKKNYKYFKKESHKMYKASYKAAWLSAIFLPIVQLITAVILGAVLWAGGSSLVSKSITLGDLQVFISYVTFIMWPIQELARVFSEMQRSLTSAERVFSLLDTKPEIEDTNESIKAESIQGSIEFDNVNFYYDPEKPVLKNFSLFIKRNETIALVGPTGGGKTTITNLIGRFYEPKSGKILINGEDYTNYSLHSLQSKLGIILQTPHLFSGTVMENIRYGRLDATDEEVIEAAKTAHADHFITAMGKGYHEEVGEGGALLSVGQKQLISIARAMLSNPEIIIMDEATSSIDTLTEDLIQKGLSQLVKKATCFIIAHRLSTIKHADRILVIENGVIKEQGTHHELLNAKGHYFNLYTKQFRSEKTQEYHVFD